MNPTATWKRGAIAALVFGFSVQPATAQEVERFYAGRKVSVVIGHEVGTGFDLYGRVLARHMGRFIPGNPNLVPENMIGVAGFAAANWLYNVAAKDGSVIAHFAHTAPFEPLLGKGTGRFDASKFTWIGNMDAVVGVCGVWDHAGVTPVRRPVHQRGNRRSGRRRHRRTVDPVSDRVAAAARRQDQADPGLQGLGRDQARAGARRVAGHLRHPGLDA